MRGANCWTDHELVTAKLQLRAPCVHAESVQQKSFSVHKLALSVNRDAYVKCLEDVLHDHLHRSDLSSEDI